MMWNFSYGLNVSGGVDQLHHGFRFHPQSMDEPWRGVAGTSQLHPDYGKYQYYIPCKESAIRAPSDMITIGDQTLYKGNTDDSFGDFIP